MRTAFAIAAALAILGTPAFSDVPSTANAVFVGGTPIIRVRVAAGGYTPEQRASNIQGRVNELLSIGPIYRSDITIAPQGADFLVLVKGRLLFTADSATAQFNQSTTRDLAQLWASNMRNVLPSLTEAK